MIQIHFSKDTTIAELKKKDLCLGESDDPQIIFRWGAQIKDFALTGKTKQEAINMLVKSKIITSKQAKSFQSINDIYEEDLSETIIEIFP